MPKPGIVGDWARIMPSLAGQYTNNRVLYMVEGASWVRVKQLRAIGLSVGMGATFFGWSSLRYRRGTRDAPGARPLRANYATGRPSCPPAPPAGDHKRCCRAGGLLALLASARDIRPDRYGLQLRLKRPARRLSWVAVAPYRG